MKPGAVPPIAPTDLRDHADPEKVDRIWRRIERDLPISEPMSRSGPPRLVWAVAAAMAFGAFAGGLAVGRISARHPQAQAPEAIASRDRVVTDVFAAGSHTRQVALPG